MTQPIDALLKASVNAAGSVQTRPWSSTGCIEQQTINSLYDLISGCLANLKIVASIRSVDTLGCAPIESYGGPLKYVVSACLANLKVVACYLPTFC